MAESLMPGRAASSRAKVALVTNCAEFIGPEIVKMLSAIGVHVVAADPSFVDPAVADEFAATTGAEVVMQDDPVETFRRARLRSGPFDILCTGGVHPAEAIAAEQLRKDRMRSCFEALALDPLEYAGLVFPEMRENGGGRIVFVTSAGPIGGIPGYSVYAAARAALNGAVRSLAMEMASAGVSVNAVAPNYIATEAYYPQALISRAEVREKLLSRVPMGRFGDPAEAAEAVRLFATQPAGFITGQVLAVAGGW